MTSEFSVGSARCHCGAVDTGATRPEPLTCFGLSKAEDTAVISVDHGVYHIHQGTCADLALKRSGDPVRLTERRQGQRMDTPSVHWVGIGNNGPSLRLVRIYSRSISDT